MSAKPIRVRVPALPKAILCSASDPASLTKCDRKQGHQGDHSWALVAKISRLQDELNAAMKW